MTDRDIASAVSHPGRIRMGVTICASSTAASTDLVPTGRTTAAQILRVAASNAPRGSSLDRGVEMRTGLICTRVEVMALI